MSVDVYSSSTLYDSTNIKKVMARYSYYNYSIKKRFEMNKLSITKTCHKTMF